jgi:hypothetical protein
MCFLKLAKPLLCQRHIVQGTFLIGSGKVLSCNTFEPLKVTLYSKLVERRDAFAASCEKQTKREQKKGAITRSHHPLFSYHYQKNKAGNKPGSVSDDHLSTPPVTRVL